MKPNLNNDYFDEIAYRESGGKTTPLDSPLRYNLTNEYSYLGKYQMGTAALVEAGFYQGKVYNLTQIYDDSKWTGLAKSLGVDSASDFLNSPSAQETAIRNFTDKQWKQIEALGLDVHVGSKINDILITPEGLLAGAHLKGTGAVRKFFLHSIDSMDANQTPVSSYMKIFDNKIEYTGNENSWIVGNDVTIDLIAAATNSSINQIRSANPNINVYALNQGQTLNLPSVQNNLLSTGHSNFADKNNNSVPDILESQLTHQKNSLHASFTNQESSETKSTQDQIVAKFIMQNIQKAIERGESLPTMHHVATESQIG